MSPAQRPDELVPLTFRDFTAGLWERGNDREVPPNGLLECLDCMPLAMGGVRAAWAWRKELRGALPADGLPIGFGIDPGYRTFAASQQRMALLVMTSTNTVGRYSMFGTSSTVLGAAGFAWTLFQTHTSADPIHTPFVEFAGTTDGSAPSWYYSINGSTGSTDSAGIWRTSRIDSTVVGTRVLADNINHFAVFQQRLVYVGPKVGFAGIPSILTYTDPSTHATPPSSNFLEISDRTEIGSILASNPDDLFAMARGNGLYHVQGDIGSGPFVRTVMESGTPGDFTWMFHNRAKGGIIYPSPTEGLLWWIGGQTVNLTPQFVGAPMVERVRVRHDSNHRFTGGLGAASKWLFTPKGYVYDFDMGCWFRTSMPDGATYLHWAFNPIFERMYTAGAIPSTTNIGAATNLNVVSASMNDSTMTRSGTFSFTLPLIDTVERNVEVRFIEIFGQGFGNGGTWTMTVTNDQGQSETASATVSAQADSARFRVGIVGDWLKVRIQSEGASDATSETGKSEAPMVSQVVVWTRARTKRQ